MTTNSIYLDERDDKDPMPHTLLETLAYTNNCVRALTDKIRSLETKLYNESSSPIQNIDKICNLSEHLTKLKADKGQAYKNRHSARKAIDGLFASLKG